MGKEVVYLGGDPRKHGREAGKREGERKGLALESPIPSTSRKDPAHVRLNNWQARLAFLLREMGCY